MTSTLFHEGKYNDMDLRKKKMLQKIFILNIHSKRNFGTYCATIIGTFKDISRGFSQWRRHLSWWTVVSHNLKICENLHFYASNIGVWAQTWKCFVLCAKPYSRKIIHSKSTVPGVVLGLYLIHALYKNSPDKIQ